VDSSIDPGPALLLPPISSWDAATRRTRRHDSRARSAAAWATQSTLCHGSSLVRGWPGEPHGSCGSRMPSRQIGRTSSAARCTDAPRAGEEHGLSHLPGRQHRAAIDAESRRRESKGRVSRHRPGLKEADERSFPLPVSRSISQLKSLQDWIEEQEHCSRQHGVHMRYCMLLVQNSLEMVCFAALMQNAAPHE